LVERGARLIDALLRRELRGGRRCRVRLRQRAEADQADGRDRQKPKDEPRQKSHSRKRSEESSAPPDQAQAGKAAGNLASHRRNPVLF
jgi:hypothetical protein